MKVYVDTSVFGGYFDEDFSEWSVKLIEQFMIGEKIAVISDITEDELKNAPEKVRTLFYNIPAEQKELVKLTNEAKELANKYIKEKVVTKKSLLDAQHIAIATLNKVDVLVSWNFKHIVNYNKIRLYNSVNLKYGYPLLEIRNPRELTDEN